MNANTNTLFVSAAALLATAALAHAHAGFDISPQLVGSQLITNGVTHATDTHPLTGETTPGLNRYLHQDLRVFGIEFGENPSFPRRSASPGINAETGAYLDAETGATVNLTGTNLPQGSLLSFTVLSPLQFWTGSGFTAAPDASAISLSDGFEILSVTPTSAQQTLPLVNIPASTNVHLHLSSNLSATAPEGIYLLSARLDTSASGIANSAPLYLVYNFGGEPYEESHEAALSYVETSIIPEPSTLSLLALATLPLLTRRPRRA